jgi:WD40 repeat protein
VAWSPDGATVATGGNDGTVRLWDARTGNLQHSLLAEWAVNVLAFHPNSRILLTGTSGQGVLLWDVASGQRLPPEPQFGDAVFAATFSPDGSLFAGGDSGFAARVWETATGKPVGRPLSHQGEVCGLAFSPDGQIVLTGSSDQTARLWDARTGRPLAAPLQHAGSMTVAFAPDGKAIATDASDGFVRIWDVTRLPGPPLETTPRAQGHFPIGPDGTPFSSHTPAPDAPLSGHALVPPLRHDREVLSVRFSPDGKAVLTAGWEGTARLWSAQTGQPLCPPLEHGGDMLSAAFSPEAPRSSPPGRTGRRVSGRRPQGSRW